MIILERIAEVAAVSTHIVCTSDAVKFYVKADPNAKFKGKFDYDRKTGTFVPGTHFNCVSFELSEITTHGLLWAMESAPAILASRISDLRESDSVEYDDDMYPVTGTTTIPGVYMTSFLNGYVIKA